MTETCLNFEQMPVKIGAVSLRNPVFLAPMSGVSDVPFRKLAWEYGAGMVVSEMVASEALTTGQQEMQIKAESAGLPVHIVQLAGRQARWMGEAARLAEQSGACVIDINMGCPSKRVTNGYSGSALMRDPDHAMTLIEAVMEATCLPVTLKMRLGWDEQSINAPDLAERAERAGVKLITVHGRTRNQFYKGVADWDKVALVRERISVPLIVNGDITCAEDARRAMQCSGANGVMVGRACYGAPWLPGKIGADLLGQDSGPEPCGKAFADLVARHYDAILSHYGVQTGMRNARKHLDWYCARLPKDETFLARRKKMLTEPDPAEVLRMIADLFSVSSFQDAAA